MSTTDVSLTANYNETLSWVNTVRSDWGAAPLAGLPKGVAGQGSLGHNQLKGHCGKAGCVVANALVGIIPTGGTIEVGGTSTKIYDKFKNLVKSYKNPKNVTDFIGSFDNKQYPSLLAA